MVSHKVLNSYSTGINGYPIVASLQTQLSISPEFRQNFQRGFNADKRTALPFVADETVEEEIINPSTNGIRSSMEATTFYNSQ